MDASSEYIVILYHKVRLAYMMTIVRVAFDEPLANAIITPFSSHNMHMYNLSLIIDFYYKN